MRDYQNLITMRKCRILIKLLLIFSSTVTAIIYYVSNNGDDSANGTSPEQPGKL